VETPPLAGYLPDPPLSPEQPPAQSLVRWARCTWRERHVALRLLPSIAHRSLACHLHPSPYQSKRWPGAPCLVWARASCATGGSVSGPSSVVTTSAGHTSRSVSGVVPVVMDAAARCRAAGTLLLVSALLQRGGLHHVDAKGSQGIVVCD
jgi:hypothetical protein